jgi:hypothetical protein
MAIGEWQEGDDPFAISVDAKAAKKENADAALIWAQKYLIFETGAGKDLLDHWTRTMRHKKIAPSAAPTEFAYHAGAREFVESIHLQIEFARNGGQSPYKDR